LLRGSSRLTEFDGDWKIEKELNLEAPIVSFALVEGRPMGVGTNSRVTYLDTREGGFQLEAYPPPWVLFTAGRDRLGVLRPKEPSVILLGEDETSVTLLGTDIRARKPFAAAAGPDDKLYLLAGSASVIACDHHSIPNFIFDLALPESFHPRMIGITGDRIYLADPAGKVAFYPLDPKPSTRQSIDSMPELLSDMEPVREAARRAGYSGQVDIDLEVSEDGQPQHVSVQGPMARVPEVTDAIQAWRFRPAIRSGQPAAVPMRFSVNVQ